MDDFETVTGVGPFEGLDDDATHRVKSELYPGERVLWAARPVLKGESPGCLICAGLTTVVMAIVAFVGLFAQPLKADAGVLGAGLTAFIVAFFAAMITARAWIGRVQGGRRSAKKLYALTDRRAILWISQATGGGLGIYSVPRGGVSRVHRIEYEDGTGDVQLTHDSVNSYRGYETHLTGFLAVRDVRKVEDLARRVLVVDLPTSR